MKPGGLRAAQQEFLRGELAKYEDRFRRWAQSSRPRNDEEEYQVHRKVSFSLEADRAEETYKQRVNNQLEKAFEILRDEAQRLGNALFYDKASRSTALHGLSFDAFNREKTSRSDDPNPPENPAKLVARLSATAEGCLWQIRQWKELRKRLDSPPAFWTSLHRFRAIRLLGCQPVEARDNTQLAAIIVASFGIDPEGAEDHAWESLRSDMDKQELDKFRIEVRRSCPDLVGAQDTPKCRQILVDLTEGKIKELTAKLRRHRRKDVRNIDAKFSELKYDRSPDARDMFTYRSKCHNAYDRSARLYDKLRGKIDRDDDPRTTRVMRWEKGAELAPSAGARTTHARPASDEPAFTLPSAGGWPERVEESEFDAFMGFLPERCGGLGDRVAAGPCDETESLGALAEEVALAGGGPTHGESDGSVGSVRSDSAAFVSGDGGAAVGAIADDVRDLTTAHAETTNEAKHDEIVRSVQELEDYCVTSSSGEVSGLDTGKTNPFFDGLDRAGESVELTVDIPEVAREMAAGCWPDGVMHNTVGVGGFRGAIAQTGGPHGEVRRSTHPTALLAATVAGNRKDGLDGSAETGGPHGEVRRSTHPTVLAPGAGERGNSAIGMANLEGATPGGCCPPSVMHPP
jgi:hypothetical protein